MILDGVAGVAALALAVLTVPMANPLDPGPSAECPNDMRVVRGTHYGDMQHLCVDARKGAKDQTHCFAYHEDLSAEEGKVTEIAVCMDQFEAPNRRGERPYMMKSFNAAKKWCKARHKRVCAEEEWEFACEGPEHRPVSYGWKIEPTLCNSDKDWRAFDVDKLYSSDEGEALAEANRLYQGSPSGSYSMCVSQFGIYDMQGNVEEWVRSRKGRRYKGSLMGGFWAKPWTGCRGTNDAHEENFTFYETGFRCCADPGTLDAAGQLVTP